MNGCTTCRLPLVSPPCYAPLPLDRGGREGGRGLLFLHLLVELALVLKQETAVGFATDLGREGGKQGGREGGREGGIEGMVRERTNKIALC